MVLDDLYYNTASATAHAVGEPENEAKMYVKYQSEGIYRIHMRNSHKIRTFFVSWAIINISTTLTCKAKVDFL